MSGAKSCDFCGLSEIELPLPPSSSSSLLTRDEDGLWICHLCRNRITSLPISNADNLDLDEALKPLVGKSAGAICRTMELPFVPPFRSIIEAASKIAYDQDLYLSAWLFTDQWMDGTTIWESEDGQQIALVFPDGRVQIEQQ